MSKNRGNPTLEQLELMGIVQCSNRECNAVNHVDEILCRSCGQVLKASKGGQKKAVSALLTRTMDKETEWPTPRALTHKNGMETQSRTSKRTKAEIMALDKAKREFPGCDIFEQPFKLPLTGGGTYTPDLLIRNPRIPGMRVIEVKGGYRGAGWEQGIERYKRAKYEWKPWIGFALWTYDNKIKGWRVE